MSYPDSPGWPDPSDPGRDEPHPGRQRARHVDAAPDAYPEPGRDADLDLDFHVEFDRPVRDRGRSTPGEDGPRHNRRRVQTRRRGERRGMSGDGGERDEAPGGAGWADQGTPGDGSGWAEPRTPLAGSGWADQGTPMAGSGWADQGTPTVGWADPAATAEIAAITDGDRAATGVNGADPAVGTDPGAAPEQANPNGRAGRNLPAAIGVGVTLGAVVVASLFVWRPAFLGVVAVAICVATWEMVRAVRPSDTHPPLVPLLAGGVAMSALAWFGGAEALTLGLIATSVAALVWRLADGPVGYQRDVVAAMLIAVYVPFLGSFSVLLLRPEDGALRVVAAIAGVVLSDTGGYVAGVFFGKHPMAPSVSPKKSWEGFAGSLVATAIGGAVMLYFMFDVAVWYGAIFGLAVSAASVLGDLAESLLKRDLGIKDMSTLLPGHGGLMDRLDSILFALPAAYAVLALVAPAVT
jgi:phosphatidate cytidylyltransferase